MFTSKDRRKPIFAGKQKVHKVIYEEKKAFTSLDAKASYKNGGYLLHFGRLQKPHCVGEQAAAYYEESPELMLEASSKNGGYLLSHGCAVPSARAGLTSLFGMGRGGTPPL